ncbi:hypothetical protein [Brucella grignonensis]|nr:hypothetical protein [Brucella grignonensis]
MTPADTLTFDNTTQPITEWALDYGITAKIIIDRLNRGWTAEQAITIPMHVAPKQRLISPELKKYIHRRPRLKRSANKDNPVKKRKIKTIDAFGESRSIEQWSKLVGISYKIIMLRLCEGIEIEDALTMPLKPKGRKKVKVNVSSEAGGGKEL